MGGSFLSTPGTAGISLFLVDAFRLSPQPPAQPETSAEVPWERTSCAFEASHMSRLPLQLQTTLNNFSFLSPSKGSFLGQAESSAHIPNQEMLTRGKEIAHDY